MHWRLYATNLVTLCLVLGLRQCFSQTGDYTLNLVHLNDFHARFEQTSVYSGRCSEKDVQQNRCYGGFARIRTQVRDLKKSKPNVIFMAAGDYYQGTVWYTIHKWKALAHFLNMMDQDVMAVGNHEFDDGVEGLVPFLDNVTFPVVAANIDDSQEPSIRGKIKPSVVLTRGGRKIGIIGYLTTETAMIASPGKVKIMDEVEGVRKESQRLRRKGVDIIIALGHAGFRKDLDIAMYAEDVDIVVGGHTNTFLYSGSDPSTEPSVGDYPTVVKQKSGRKVLVIQAYAFGKYLGHLEVNFDPNGEITNWRGNPILMDNTISQDPEVLRELIPWRSEIESIIMETIGRTFVFLDGNRFSCRMKECNLGNLETDAIIHQNAKYPDDMNWAQTSLAVLNGGGIRSSIDERTSNGSISMEDILTVAPFQNTIDIIELRGIHVREMFEHSVANYDPAGLDPPGGFLQVSGFHIVYDITKPTGSRVVSLAARCVQCRVPEFRDVEDNEIYKIAMPSFIANGGDGYSVINDNKINHHLTGLLDTDAFSQYIGLYTPIYQGIENRILFLHSSDPCSALQDPPLAPQSSNSTSSSTTQSPVTTSTTTQTPSVAPPRRNPSSSTGIPLKTNDLSGTLGTLSKGSISSNKIDRNPPKRTKTRKPAIGFDSSSVDQLEEEYEDIYDLILEEFDQDSSLADDFEDLDDDHQSFSEDTLHLMEVFNTSPLQLMKETMKRHDDLFFKERGIKPTNNGTFFIVEKDSDNDDDDDDLDDRFDDFMAERRFHLNNIRRGKQRNSEFIRNGGISDPRGHLQQSRTSKNSRTDRTRGKADQFSSPSQDLRNRDLKKKFLSPSTTQNKKSSFRKSLQLSPSPNIGKSLFQSSSSRSLAENPKQFSSSLEGIRHSVSSSVLKHFGRPLPAFSSPATSLEMRKTLSASRSPTNSRSTSRKSLLQSTQRLEDSRQSSSRSHFGRPLPSSSSFRQISNKPPSQLSLSQRPLAALPLPKAGHSRIGKPLDILPQNSRASTSRKSPQTSHFAQQTGVPLDTTLIFSSSKNTDDPENKGIGKPLILTPTSDPITKISVFRRPIPSSSGNPTRFEVPTFGKPLQSDNSRKSSANQIKALNPLNPKGLNSGTIINTPVSQSFFVLGKNSGLSIPSIDFGRKLV